MSRSGTHLTPVSGVEEVVNYMYFQRYTFGMFLSVAIAAFYGKEFLEVCFLERLKEKKALC